MLHICLTEWKSRMKNLPAQSNCQALVVTMGNISEAHPAKRKLFISLYQCCPRITTFLQGEAQYITKKWHKSNLWYFLGYFFLLNWQGSTWAWIFFWLWEQNASAVTPKTQWKRVYYHYRLYHMKSWGSHMNFILTLFNISQHSHLSYHFFNDNICACSETYSEK